MNVQRKSLSMGIKKKYKLVQNKDAKWQGIGLTKEAGFYQGVVYRYGKVTPIEEDDRLRLKFDWEILDSNGLGKEHFNDDFFNLIGDILYDIMDEQLKDGSLQYVNTDN
tara:strand:- start:193 stop:519 length:327 start_codon:yes stop_codon:yes gene_type:complete